MRYWINNTCLVLKVGNMSMKVINFSIMTSSKTHCTVLSTTKSVLWHWRLHGNTKFHSKALICCIVRINIILCFLLLLRPSSSHCWVVEAVDLHARELNPTPTEIYKSHLAILLRCSMKSHLTSGMSRTQTVYCLTIKWIFFIINTDNFTWYSDLCMVKW